MEADAVLRKVKNSSVLNQIKVLENWIELELNKKNFKLKKELGAMRIRLSKL